MEMWAKSSCYTERINLSLEYEKDFTEEIWGRALKDKPEVSGSQK